jgi:pimeloyl-ACP methyl ester carboxylesterase
VKNLRSAAAAIFLLSSTLAPASLRAAPSSRSGTFETHGVSLYWEEQGDPAHPPLLLVHGFGESMAVWKPYLETLATEYDVVLLDLRGHGRSTNPADTFSFAAAAEDMLALMDHLHHPRFRAVGVSAGGMALLHIATEAPSRLEALAIVGAAPYLPAQARARVGQIAADKETMPYLRQFATRGDPQTAALLREFAALGDSISDPAFTPPQLAAVSAPTLIVYGDRDEFFPVELALELYRSIPRSYLKVEPNAGHEPIYDPKAVAGFSRLLLDFFGGSWWR